MRRLPRRRRAPTAAPDRRRRRGAEAGGRRVDERRSSRMPGGTVVPIRRRPRTAWFAAAAAAAVIAIGGLAWSPWSDDTEQPSPMAQVAAAADAQRVSSTKGALTAEVAYSRQLGKAAITVTGLPPAPDGQDLPALVRRARPGGTLGRAAHGRRRGARVDAAPGDANADGQAVGDDAWSPPVARRSRRPTPWWSSPSPDRPVSP